MRLPNAVRYAVTRADFPEQDWPVWEARKYTHPGLGRTVDTSYLNIWPCCIHCATWICSSCWDFRRNRADRRVSQYCGKCGGRDGFFVVTRHGTRNPHTPDGSHLPKLPFVVSAVNPVRDGVGDPRANLLQDLIEGDSHRIDWARRTLDAIQSLPMDQMRQYVKDHPYQPIDQLEKIGRQEYKWAVETLDATRGMTEVEAAAYIRQHPYVPTLPDWPLLKYYKSLAAEDPGRDKLWENQVRDDMTEEEAVAAGMLPAKQVDPEEKRGWGVKQPDELEHRDPGYSCEGRVTDAQQDAAEKAMDSQLEEKLRVARTEQAEIMKRYPYKDGDVLVLGPEIFVNPDAEVICWRGENWVRQPEPGSAAMMAERSQDHLKREALEWAIRGAAPASSTQRSADRTKQLLDTADNILEWLTK